MNGHVFLWTKKYLVFTHVYILPDKTIYQSIQDKCARDATISETKNQL